MQPISRSRPAKSLMTVDESIAADRQYFVEHPGEEEFIREFCPGEFGAAELPEIPPGSRFATCVSRLWRDGEPVGRYRSLMTVCDGQPLQELIRASP
jgi:hypothetical protein